MMAETEQERVEREYHELLEEIRVTLPGVEVILAFLLTVPFTERFGQLDELERHVYAGALLCVAVAVALLLAPSAYHRIRFQADDKAWITRRGNALVLWAMAILVPGIVGALFVVTDVIFNRAFVVGTAGVLGLLLVALWFLVPLLRRRG